MIKYLSSVKTALILMTAIIITSIFATFDPNTQIYNSYFFKGLLFLFIVNTALCTIKRFPAFLSKMRCRSFTDLRKCFPDDYKLEIQEIDLSKEKIIYQLQQKRYKVQCLQNNHEEIIHAKKGIISLISAQMLHIALIIVFVGAFLSTFGSDVRISGLVGQFVDVPKKTTKSPVKIKIDQFNTIYNPDKTILNWESKFTLFDRTKKISGKTSVNHPFIYHGITIYQSSYGFVNVLEVNQNGNKSTYFIQPKKIFSLVGRVFYVDKDTQEKLVMKVFENFTHYKTYELKEGNDISISDHITLRYLGEKVYTIFKVKHDPGVPVVMIGLIVLALCFILLFTGPYHEIMVLLDKIEQTVQVNVICKNKIIKENLTNKISNLFIGEGG